MPHKIPDFSIIKNYKTENGLVQFYNHKPLVLASNECGMHDFRLIEPASARVQESYTLHFVLRGKGKYTLAEKSFSIKENDIFVTPAGVKLHTIPDPEDPWKYFWFGFEGNGFQEICSKAFFTVNEPVYSCEDCAENIRAAIQRLIDFIPARDESTRLFSLSTLLQIFALVTEERTKNMKLNASVYSKEYFLQRALEILEENYSDPEFRIESLCERLSVSHSYLCRIFKKLSNSTVSEALIRIRMLEARVLLDKNDISMADVAFKCGFNDYAYFSKTFKKMFSMSPQQYRKSQQQSPSKKK